MTNSFFAYKQCELTGSWSNFKDSMGMKLSQLNRQYKRLPAAFENVWFFHEKSKGKSPGVYKREETGKVRC